MPTYEYECDYCEHKFEEIQSFKDDPLKVCPECGMEALRRLFGCGAGFIFKGSGFYQNDYPKTGNVPKPKTGGGGPHPMERMEQISDMEKKYGSEEVADRYEKAQEKNQK